DLALSFAGLWKRTRTSSETAPDSNAPSPTFTRSAKAMAKPMRLSQANSYSAPRSPEPRAAARTSGAIIPMSRHRNARSSQVRPMLPPLPDVVLEPIVKLALAEDLGVAGDVTTDALIDPETQGRWAVRAREAGVVAGLDAAILAGAMIDPNIQFTVHAPDGARVKAGDTILEIEGAARSVLMAERT